MKNYSNILMISGSGRKTGKTTLACEIIKKLSQKHNVIGIKVSPHKHTDVSLPVIYRKADISIQREMSGEKNKDSSRMLNAGAIKVYLVYAAGNSVIEALDHIPYESSNAIICESGFYSDYFHPGLRIFVYDSLKEKKNEDLKKVSQLVINTSDSKNNFDISDIYFENNTWRFKA